MSTAPDESAISTARAERQGRSFYASRVADFQVANPDAIIGQLASRHIAFHASAEAEQMRAWAREIILLKTALAEVGGVADDWWLLLEAPLLRLGKRLDAVILAPGVVGVVEFKIGASAYNGADRVQTERYAQSLRDFHEVSQRCLILPVLCAEQAPARPLSVSVFDGVADLIFANATTLGAALLLLAKHEDPGAEPLDGLGFDLSPYRPTPTIVEAAQALYAGHQIAEIGRGDAADAELQAAAATLQTIVREAEFGHERSSASSRGRLAPARRFWDWTWL